jgi:hypothetical protein
VWGLSGGEHACMSTAGRLGKEDKKLELQVTTRLCRDVPRQRAL